MGRPTLPTTFDLHNRAKIQPPKGSDEVVKYINRLFGEMYNDSSMCENGRLMLSLNVFDDFNCDHIPFMRYLTLLGYEVDYNRYDYSIIIRW